MRTAMVESLAGLASLSLGRTARQVGFKPEWCSLHRAQQEPGLALDCDMGHGGKWEGSRTRSPQAQPCLYEPMHMAQNKLLGMK